MTNSSQEKSSLYQFKSLFRLSHASVIARRYAIVNGFDGAITMLGLILGFYLSSPTELGKIINVCFAATIALTVSGFSSAYLSESAERMHSLNKLQKAMIKDLSDSAHHEVSRWVPIFIALVNGLSPLAVCSIIMTPLWIANTTSSLIRAPLLTSLFLACIVIFAFGIFLGSIAKISLTRSVIQTSIVAIVTLASIYLLTA